MRSIAGKLLLRGESIVKAEKHSVYRFAQLLEFGDGFLFEFYLRDILGLDMLSLLGEFFKRRKKSSRYKKCNSTENSGDKQSDDPTHYSEFELGVSKLSGEIIIECVELFGGNIYNDLFSGVVCTFREWILPIFFCDVFVQHTEIVGSGVIYEEIKCDT